MSALRSAGYAASRAHHLTTLYVFGEEGGEGGAGTGGGAAKPKPPFPTLAVITPTSDGWRVRSTSRRYNHDYVCYEPLQEVLEWVDLELRRPFVASGRAETLKLLTSSGSAPRTGYLLPGGCASRREEAERALRHLERGW